MTILDATKYLRRLNKSAPEQNPSLEAAAASEFYFSENLFLTALANSLDADFSSVSDSEMTFLLRAAVAGTAFGQAEIVREVGPIVTTQERKVLAVEQIGEVGVSDYEQYDLAFVRSENRLQLVWRRVPRE